MAKTQTAPLTQLRQVISNIISRILRGDEQKEIIARRQSHKFVV